MAEKATANDLLIGNEAEEHTIETPFGEMTVWVKQLTWLERQNALTKFVSISADGGDMTPKIDFGGYWKFVITTCVEKTEPSLTTSQLLNIKPEVGEALQSILPSFEDLMRGIAGGSAPLG